MDAFEVFQKVLRYLFYICVVISLVCYAAEYFFGMTNVYWFYAALIAIGCSLVRFFLRFI